MTVPVLVLAPEGKLGAEIGDELVARREGHQVRVEHNWGIERDRDLVLGARKSRELEIELPPRRSRSRDLGRGR